MAIKLVALSVRSPNRGPFLDPNGVQYLNPVAAAAFEAVAAAFEAHFDKTLVPDEARRSWDRQNYLYTQWNKHVPGFSLATKPGTSTHEDEHGAKAVDFGSGVQTVGSTEHSWMVEFGPTYGWIWTGKNFKPQEGWHFEQNGTVVADSGKKELTTEQEQDVALIRNDTTAAGIDGAGAIVALAPGVCKIFKTTGAAQDYGRALGLPSHSSDPNAYQPWFGFDGSRFLAVVKEVSGQPFDYWLTH